MLEVLTRWENNDFSNAVEEHNYFWKKLGGTIGKATSVKEQNIFIHLFIKIVQATQPCTIFYLFN